MPTLLEALMHAGAAYIRGETEGRDLQEQRRREALSRALEMRTMLERTALAQRAQAFEEKSTLAGLDLQRQGMAAEEAHRARMAAMQEGRYATEDARYAAQQRAIQAAARMTTLQGLRGAGVTAIPQRETQAVRGPVAAGPSGVPYAPVRSPAWQAPRMTMPSRTLAPEGRQGATLAGTGKPLSLPVPQVTDDMLLGQPLAQAASAPLQPAAEPEGYLGLAQAPLETLQHELMAAQPETRWTAVGETLMPTVPTPSETAALTHEQRMRDFEVAFNTFKLEHELPERIREMADADLRRQVFALYGLPMAELDYLLKSNEARISDVNTQITELTAPQAIAAAREELRKLQLDNDILDTTLRMKRYEAGYLERTGAYPGTHSEHTAYSYAFSDPAQLELDWATEARLGYEATTERMKVLGGVEPPPGAGAAPVGRAPTVDESKARDAAFKAMEALVAGGGQGEEPADPAAVAHQVLSYMRQAGPLAPDIGRAFYAHFARSWRENPEAWEDWREVPWQSLWSVAGWGTPVIHEPGESGAAPFGGSRSRPGAPP